MAFSITVTSINCVFWTIYCFFLVLYSVRNLTVVCSTLIVCLFCSFGRSPCSFRVSMILSYYFNLDSLAMVQLDCRRTLDGHKAW